MQKIRVQTPAKINLTLEVLNKREDGFHNIQSIMQTISLSDFLSITIDDALQNEINLTGTSTEIPYNEKNIAYKAAKLYLEETQTCGKKIQIHIEKNIPVCAGLAGGSANASGTLFALNKIFNKLTRTELHNLASKLGSDLNFCLDGGCALCTGRGENIEKIPCQQFNISLIKPQKIGISAKEAYQKFAQLSDKSNPNNTTKLKNILTANKFDKSLIYNSLENAVINDYKELQMIKQTIPNSIMSGSGPTFFVINENINTELFSDDFEIHNGLTSVNFGVKTV